MHCSFLMTKQCQSYQIQQTSLTWQGPTFGSCVDFPFTIYHHYVSFSQLHCDHLDRCMQFKAVVCFVCSMNTFMAYNGYSSEF